MASDLDDAAGTELDALDGLGSLLDKSLVRPLDATDGDGMPRVVMLETIKAYATAQLDTRPDFAEAARESHARYFADLARDPATTESAAAELDNLRIAWANAVGRKDLDATERPCARRCGRSTRRAAGITRRSSSPTISSPSSASSPDAPTTGRPS